MVSGLVSSSTKNEFCVVVLFICSFADDTVVPILTDPVPLGLIWTFEDPENILKGYATAVSSAMTKSFVLAIDPTLHICDGFWKNILLNFVLSGTFIRTASPPESCIVNFQAGFVVPIPTLPDADTTNLLVPTCKSLPVPDADTINEPVIAEFPFE